KISPNPRTPVRTTVPTVVRVRAEWTLRYPSPCLLRTARSGTTRSPGLGGGGVFSPGGSGGGAGGMIPIRLVSSLSRGRTGGSGAWPGDGRGRAEARGVAGPGGTPLRDAAPLTDGAGPPLTDRGGAPLTDGGGALLTGRGGAPLRDGGPGSARNRGITTVASSVVAVAAPGGGSGSTTLADPGSAGFGRAPLPVFGGTTPAAGGTVGITAVWSGSTVGITSVSTAGLTGTGVVESFQKSQTCPS